MPWHDIWHDHGRLRDMHSVLSPSQHHWLNYDEDRLVQVMDNRARAALGTKLHAYAETAIKLGRRQPETKDAINMFVNDAIGFRMSPEQVLFYSQNMFGTADAIVFDGSLLRIHDLKTGLSPGHPAQLEIYAAVFCLEYDVKPNDIEIILRIYQSGAINEWSPTAETIMRIMGVIISHNRLIEDLKDER